MTSHLPPPRLVHPQRVQPAASPASPAWASASSAPGSWRSRVARVASPARRRSTCSPSTARDYLVAPRGEAEWVRNVRAADGHLTLLLGRRRDDRTATEVTDPDKVPVLRAYLRRWKAEVGVFFEGVGPDSTDEELAAIAPRHPVFALSARTRREHRRAGRPPARGWCVLGDRGHGHPAPRPRPRRWWDRCRPRPAAARPDRRPRPGSLDRRGRGEAHRVRAGHPLPLGWAQRTRRRSGRPRPRRPPSRPGPALPAARPARPRPGAAAPLRPGRGGGGSASSRPSATARAGTRSATSPHSAQRPGGARDRRRAMRADPNDLASGSRPSRASTALAELKTTQS